MTEHTEKDVLMKCTKCGYEEEIPRTFNDSRYYYCSNTMHLIN